MEQCLLALVLIGLIIFELQYFELYDIYGLTREILFVHTREILYTLKRSEYYLQFLYSSFFLVVVGMIFLYRMKKQIKKEKVAQSSAKIKTRSELQKEINRETRRSVDALMNSEDYKRHKQQYRTSEDFINERILTSDDEVSLDSDDSDDSRSS